MKIVEEEKYLSWKGKNTDGYGSATFRYAEAWANLMEAELAKGHKLEDIAQKSSHVADTEGITGFMHGYAVNILSRHWEHGSDLKLWHNTKHGEPNTHGVVNPAIVTLGKKEE